MINMAEQVSGASVERHVIPDIFCWTKMGAEAGQGLQDILHRKELERAAGNGCFAWGIGNSLGNSARLAQQQSPNGEVDVLFTPMRSAAKAIDTNPSKLFLWLYYENVTGGICHLPEHALVTSRGQEGKRYHYALLCHSSEKIEPSDLGGFDASSVRNLISSNPVGASQVTSVVRYQTMEMEKQSYRVSFKAKLHGDGFVKLIQPVEMNHEMVLMYEDACRANTPEEWGAAIAELKEYARNTSRHHQQMGLCI